MISKCNGSDFEIRRVSDWSRWRLAAFTILCVIKEKSTVADVCCFY